jgi:hypothetical protein
MGSALGSEELRRLTMGPAAVGMARPLKELQEFTDWEQAAEMGRVIPHSGAEANFDDADARVCLPFFCVRAKDYTHRSSLACLYIPVFRCLHV